MERGLLWLPLLVIFFWLAWSGWDEFQKIEAYRRWSEAFEQSKYDIYSILGKQGSQLTWGQPTRKEPKELQSFDLANVQALKLLVDNQPVDTDNLPKKGKPYLEFILKGSTESIKIPFTEIPLAAKWRTYLEKELAANIEH